MEHLTRDQIERLVAAGPPLPNADVRRHAAECPKCARALAEEARLELALHELAAHRGDESRGVGRSVIRTPATWVTAAAMLVTLAIGLAWYSISRPPARDVAVTPVLSGYDDSPCFVDPCLVGPGADVMAPRDLARYVLHTAVTESL